MSYSSRKAPNMSQYLRTLNVQESHMEDKMMADDELAKDLAMFTNTQFYDYDSGQNTDFQAPPVKPEVVEAQPATTDAAASDSIMDDFGNMDFLSGDFSFGGFDTTYTSPTIPSFPDNHLGTLQPIQPNPSAGYPGSVHHPQQSPAGYPPHPQRTPSDGGLKHDGVAPPNRSMNFEEASRMAAEEDKRRRNTAASARFRIKKKQREQALEKSAKDMNDKVSRLENRVTTLETENKWLKDMLMEKHDGKIDLDKLWKAFSIAKEKTPPKERSSKSKSSIAAALSEPEDSDASSESNSRSR